MLTDGGDGVADDPVVAFQKEDFAFDGHGIAETRKAVVRGGDEVETVFADPLFERAARDRFPRERAVWFGGGLVVDSYRVVGVRAAKPIARVLRAGVGVRAGVDENRAAVGSNIDRQGVRVRLAAGERSVWTAIE